MALVKCKKCGKEISNRAEKCIHCNFPTRSKNSKNINKNHLLKICLKYCLLVLIFLIIILGIYKSTDYIRLNSVNKTIEENNSKIFSEQKLIDYLIAEKNATCVNNKCNYRTVAYFGNIEDERYKNYQRHTIDFEKKKYYKINHPAEDPDIVYDTYEYDYLNKIAIYYQDYYSFEITITIFYNEDDTYTYELDCPTEEKEIFTKVTLPGLIEIINSITKDFLKTIEDSGANTT